MIHGCVAHILSIVGVKMANAWNCLRPWLNSESNFVWLCLNLGLPQHDIFGMAGLIFLVGIAPLESLVSNKALMYLSTGLKQNNTQKERKAWHEFGALDPCQDTHRYQHIAPRLCRPGNKIAFAIRSAPFELLRITNSQNWMHHEYSNPQKDIYKNLKSESNMVVNCQTSSTIINNLYLCLFLGLQQPRSSFDKCGTSWTKSLNQTLVTRANPFISINNQ